MFGYNSTFNVDHTDWEVVVNQDVIQLFHTCNTLRHFVSCEHDSRIFFQMVKVNNSDIYVWQVSESNDFEEVVVIITFFDVHSSDQDHLVCFYFTHFIEILFRQFSDFDFVVYTDHEDNSDFTLVSDHVEQVTRITTSLLCYRFN